MKKLLSTILTVTMLVTSFACFSAFTVNAEETENNIVNEEVVKEFTFSKVLSKTKNGANIVIKFVKDNKNYILATVVGIAATGAASYFGYKIFSISSAN